VVSLFTLGVATLSVNVAANVVSPSNDFSNLSPRLISFRTGGIITGVIGIAIQPWRLLESPEAYIFTWLDFYGGLLGAVGGVLVADYWLVRKARLDADDLYRPHGIYRYVSGWNPIAVVATLVGMLFAVGGAHSEPGKGPFPEDGLIPVLKPLYSYSWVLGFVIALVLYALVMRATGRAESFERDRGLGSRA
jgi:NCS1 family nucleobase:cation symporter-1